MSWAELILTCEVDMREVSCRPVKSDEEMLTGAPRWSLMLTFRSRSTPVTGRGEDVFAAQPENGKDKLTTLHVFNAKHHSLVVILNYSFSSINTNTHRKEKCLPVCEVGVRGVGGAPSWVPRGLPDTDGMPLAAGFLLCLSLSSRSLLSLSASSAARLAPWGRRRWTIKIKNDSTGA